MNFGFCKEREVERVSQASELRSFVLFCARYCERSAKYKATVIFFSVHFHVATCDSWLFAAEFPSDFSGSPNKPPLSLHRGRAL
jgi:hypothetical protein